MNFSVPAKMKREIKRKIIIILESETIKIMFSQSKKHKKINVFCCFRVKKNEKNYQKREKQKIDYARAVQAFASVKSASVKSDFVSKTTARNHFPKFDFDFCLKKI